MIPIRCLSCGKPVSAYFDEYNKRIAEGEKSKDILDDLGLTRYCCRRMLISHVETWEQILQSVGIFYYKILILVKYMPKNGSNIHEC